MMKRPIAFLTFFLTFQLTAQAGIILGNPYGKVSLVEFYDYQCPHCQKMAPIIQHLIEHNQNLRVVLRPVASINHLSKLEAMSVLAAQKQDQAGAIHNLLMKNVISRSPKIFQLAKSIHIDISKLEHAMFQRNIKEKLRANLKALESGGYTRVPLIIIGGTKANQASHVFNRELTEQHLKDCIKQVSKRYA